MKRFRTKYVKLPNGCWEWQAFKNKGYGMFQYKGRPWLAHRVAYLLEHRLSPEDMEGVVIRHLCHNRACVNPKHLDEGTHQDNKDDAVLAGRHARGEKTGTARLSKEDILLIREAWANRELTQAEFAEEFNISQPHVSDIVNRRRWAHL